MTTRPSERGNAAVEMILVIPVLLTFLVGIRHGSAMFLHDIHASTAVRNAAWKSSLYSHARSSPIPVPGVGGSSRTLCQRTRLQQDFGGTYRMRCRDDAGVRGRGFHTTYLRDLQRAGRGEWRDSRTLTREIGRPRQRAQFREASVESRYRSLDFDWATARWSNGHAVDANRVWQRRDMHNGYDRVLRRQGSRNLFRRAFPAATR